MLLQTSAVTLRATRKKQAAVVTVCLLLLTTASSQGLLPQPANHSVQGRQRGIPLSLHSRCCGTPTCHVNDSQPSVTPLAIVLRSGFAAVSPWNLDIFDCRSFTCRRHNHDKGRCAAPLAPLSSYVCVGRPLLMHTCLILYLLTHYVERVL